MTARGRPSVAFSHHIFLQQQYGGISRYFVEVAARLGGHGCAATVVAPVYVNRHLAEAERVPVVGVRVPAPAARRGAAWRANDLLSRAWLAARRPDVLHLTYYPLAPVRAGRARTVVSVYDMIHERLPEFFPAADATAAHKRRAVLAADHVICISEQTRRDLVDLYPEVAGRASVVLLGHTLQAPPAAATAPLDAPYLLYVGLRGGYKNFARLAAAYAASTLPGAGVQLVCFGGGAFDAAERDALAAAGVDAAHVHHRAGDDAELATYYRHAAAFAYPSLYEGFGIPPLEAMALGCPVACARAGSLPEVVGDAAELFDPRDVDAIRAALDAVVSPARAAELRRLGAERVRRFSWDACAAATRDVYRQLA